MKAIFAAGLVALAALGVATRADAHSLERVRAELIKQGYDQIEFVRTKFPVWVDACRGSTRLHLHVDWYGKVTETDETPKGSCPTEAQDEGAAEASPAPATDETAAESPGASTSKSEPQGDAGTPSNAGTSCKKYVPAAGMIVTVPCE